MTIEEYMRERNITQISKFIDHKGDECFSAVIGDRWLHGETVAECVEQVK